MENKRMDRQGKDISVVNKLTNEQYVDFMHVYSKHYRLWETPEKKEQFSLKNIEKIEWFEKEKLFHVHYKKTEHYPHTWFHYKPSSSEWW